MEQTPHDTSTREYLYIDWGFPNTKTYDIIGEELIQHPMAEQSFYTFQTANIEETQSKYRYYGQIDLIINSNDNSSNTLQEANNQEGSIIIEKPQFSNIKNGLDLFVSRTNGSRFFNMIIYSKFHIKKLSGLQFIDRIPED